MTPEAGSNHKVTTTEKKPVWRGAWQPQPRSAVLLLIAVTGLVRFLLGASLGLGIDESYTVATGRQPQFGTFDHPPLAWWLVSASRFLFGTEAALVVRLPFILLFAVTTWVIFRLTSLLYGERAGMFAAVTLNLAPVLAWTSGSWVLPDGPLNAALAVGALCIASALFGAPSRASYHWLAAGLAGGAAMMSKLHGVFLFAGVGLFLITQPQHRRWLLTPWPYAGVALAFLVFLPFIIWNAEHHWLSFAFQAGRAQVRTITLTGPFLALVGQSAVLLPWLWLPLIVCLVRAIRNGPSQPRDWLLVCLAIGPIVIFTLVSLTGSRTLPHWASPGYLFLFPLLGRAVAEAIDTGSSTVRPWLAASSASLVAILAAALALAHLPWPQITYAQGKLVPNPIEEAIDWKDLTQELKLRGLYSRARLFISATRWHEAGKIDLALGGAMPVLCLCADPRGYGVIKRSSDYLGQDALIIGRGLTKSQVQSVYGPYFEHIEPMAPLAISHAGRQAFELAVYSAEGFKRSNARPDLIDAFGLYGKPAP